MVTVTEKAIQEIKRIMQEQSLNPEETALRVRILGGGCSGFEYKLDLDGEFNEVKDNVFPTGDIKVVIDKRSSLYVDGAIVDFHDALDKRGFVVTNPNAKSTCGCGKSFSM